VAGSPIRVLLVDDYEAWHRFLVERLRNRPELEVVGLVSDGWEAVQKAYELEPDLILLDIGLSTLSGIEAARQIRSRSSRPKILFFTENCSPDIAEEAMRTGALGYVVKSEAHRDLLPAVDAVLQGKQFVSASVSVNRANRTGDERKIDRASRKSFKSSSPHDDGIAGRHDVVFYSDDLQLLERASQFLEISLQAENAAIVIATDSHLDDLARRLRASGLDLDAAIAHGRYTTLNVADALSMFMVEGKLDSSRFLKNIGDLILNAASSARGRHPRVALFGEGADFLWKQGNPEAAFQDEELCNQLTKEYDVEILCGYSLSNDKGAMEVEVFEKIMAEHSAVYCW
jgi:DNA-binding NarL/FixJ family response regulator